MGEFEYLSEWTQRDAAEATMTYSAAESATLAALHPVLGVLADRARKITEDLSESARMITDFSASFGEQRGETLMTAAMREDLDDETRAAVRGTMDKLQAELSAMDQASAESNETWLMQMLAWATAIARRRSLVEDELTRRGLLPPEPPKPSV